MAPVALAIVIPAGPADDVVDTLASIIHFTQAPRFIVIVDDTPHDLRMSLEKVSPDVHVVPAPPGALGTNGGLWVKIASGYRYVLDHFSFDILLRIDADALMIGAGIGELAAKRFAEDRTLGMLGSYRVDPTGAIRDWSPGARALALECSPYGFAQAPLRRTLRNVRKRALVNGYIPGEHPLGGAYLYSAPAVRAIAGLGFLDLPDLSRSRLGEDQLFALLTVAAGFRIGDFGGPDDPLALRWRGLPAAPEDLLMRGKLIAHSVRFWGQMSEEEIRSYFADSRRDHPR